MDKDFFFHLFSQSSAYSFDVYQRRILLRLPLLLLNTALEIAPEIEHCAGFEELYSHLANSPPHNQIWKNSELYPYINYLNLPNNNMRQQCVNSLLVHCKLRLLTRDTNPEVVHWRLSHQHPVVVYLANENVECLHNLGWIFNTRYGNIRVFRPHPNLFDDVEPNLYGSQASNESNEGLDCILQKAIDIVDDYSPEFCSRIINQLSTIVFLQESRSRPISFSLRNLFIGAIFISIASPVEIAEQIIHEYYHQCIWPWWLIEPPEDLPETEIKVVSPVSGAMRSLPTMLQATLIYASLIDFYQYMFDVGANNLGLTITDKSLLRFNTINERFDDLIDLLNSELHARPSSLGLVNKIVEVRECFIASPD